MFNWKLRSSSWTRVSVCLKRSSHMEVLSEAVSILAKQMDLCYLKLDSENKMTDFRN